VMALAERLPLFVAGLLLYGITMFVLAPLNSYVTVARGKWTVERAITFVSASYNLGAVLGPWIGGQVGEQMGLRQTYTLAAWVFVISTVIILFIRPQPVEKPALNQPRLGGLKNARSIAYVGAVVLAMFALYLPQPLTPNFLQNLRGLSLDRIGSLYSITGLGVVALNLLLGQLPGQLGFLLSQASVALFSLLIWFGTGMPWYVMGFFLLGGYKTTRALSTAQSRQLVESSRMGLAYGIMETANASGVILAPPLAGFLYSQYPLLVYPVSVALILASLLVSYRYSPARRRPEEATLTSVRRGA
jgi:predicted MFS family arabinose efflux permease